MKKDKYAFRNELLRQHITIGLLASTVFIFVFFLIEAISLLFIAGGAFISLFTLFLLSKKEDNFIINSRTFMTIVSFIFLSVFLHSSQEVFLLSFFPLYPVASFTIRGPKEGIVWSLILLIILITIYLFDLSKYNLVSFVSLVIAYLMVSHSLFVYRHYELKNFEQITKLEEKKDQILIQQAKLVNLGEIVGAITHQWRQPLSEISSNVMKVEVENNYKETSDKEVIKDSVSTIYNLLIYMSKTLDTFKSVYKSENSREEISLSSAIEDAIGIYKSVIFGMNITLNYDKTKQYTLRGLKDEFTNIVLILLKNSQDAFLDRQIKDKQISIGIDENEDSLILTYQDNAGGIQIEPISDIFKQNVSTKEEEGMGIGLYLVKKVITQRYEGDINCTNISHGVCFTITLKRFYN